MKTLTLLYASLSLLIANNAFPEIITDWATASIPIFLDYGSNFNSRSEFKLDLNNDGSDNITFTSDFGGAGFFISEGTRILGYNYGRSKNLFTSSDLLKDAVIGESDQVWGSGGYYSIVTMMVSNGTISTPDPSYSHEYYIGLEISIDNQPHYGWLRIRSPDSPSNYALVAGWAYEDEPYTPLTAGVIPEASSIILLTVGAVGIWTLRKRKYC